MDVGFLFRSNPPLTQLLPADSGVKLLDFLQMFVLQLYFSHEANYASSVNTTWKKAKHKAALRYNANKENEGIP